MSQCNATEFAKKGLSHNICQLSHDKIVTQCDKKYMIKQLLHQCHKILLALCNIKGELTSSPP